MENPLNKVLTSAPPPPPTEVKIRTMRSDIESMMRSGGGAPSFQNVAVSGLSLEREKHQAPIAERTPMPAPASFSIPAAPVVKVVAPASVSPVAAAASGAAGFAPATDAAETDSPTAQEFVPEPASESHLVPILVVTLVAILAVGVVGYFAYSLFLK
jgi:nitrate reductase NapE component